VPPVFAPAIVFLCGYAYGVNRRNAVWRTEESLCRDDVEKSPHNSRGLMNYGLTQMSKGAYATALDYFSRALIFRPNYQHLRLTWVSSMASWPTRETLRGAHRPIATSKSSEEKPVMFVNRLAHRLLMMPSQCAR
jgi:hypothetical protein